MNETHSEIANAIRSHFNGNWNYGTASVTWENAPQEISGSDPWIRVSIRFTAPLSQTIGAVCIHRRGFLSVQIFSRYDDGTGSSEMIADAIASLYEEKMIGTIQFSTADIIAVGDATRQLNHIESSWFQTVVNIPFETV